MNPLMALALSDGGAVTQYVDDVFSTYTYDGTGGASTITNGIDLAGRGGMVWFKARTSAFDHRLVDTARGATISLASNTTAANATEANGLTAFTSTGYSLNSDTDYNKASDTYVSWTFRKAPKFFDVVTYSGNGSNRTIAHSLGQEIGMMFVKRTDTTSDWQVYHRSIANTEYLVLNTTAAKATGASRWNSTTPTSSVFSVGTDATVNASGGTYVAYLFAHNAAADGNIQCGTFTNNGSGNATITLGWEPQFLMAKAIGNVSDWFMLDVARNWDVAGAVDGKTQANGSAAESTAANYGEPTATGFNFKGASSQTYVYMAVRRSNKPPTSGTQIYNAITRTGTGAVANVTGVGFAPDLALSSNRAAVSWSTIFQDRLRGATKGITSNDSSFAEFSDANTLTAFCMDGVTVGSGNYYNGTGSSYVNHFFKRAVGVFDIVCYTGTGTLGAFDHGLGIAPELVILRSRSVASNWAVLPNDATKILYLNSTAAIATTSTTWNDTAPTATTVTVGSALNTADTKVAYLFASKAGISKVGSYTGNGTSQDIDCGFSAGARFILIKRTDTTGDWFFWDTARGIIAGNDPYLRLNSTVAEVTTDDAVDPLPSGFIVNQVAATNINVNAATYIFLAFA